MTHPFEKARTLLLQGSTVEAVAEARRVRRSSSGTQADWSLAAILIDAADFARMPKLAVEGKALLERLPASIVEANRASYHYNLGNACATIGRFQRGTGAACHPATAEAVSHYDRASQLSDFADIRANLANALLKQGRYIEALDELDALLEKCPQHYNAYGFRGSALLGISGWLNGSHQGLVQTALSSYRRAVEFAQDDPVIARHFAEYVHQLEQRVPEMRAIKAKSTRKDAAWIWENRLALNPCMLCRLASPAAFDLFPMHGVFSAPRRRPPTRELYVVLNTILATYGTARWQLWMAETESDVLASDHIIQHTGGSAPLVDLRMGLRMAALAGFYRVLGQIASGLNNCLGLKHSATVVALESVWGTRKRRLRGLPKTRDQLHAGIRRRRNAPLSALYYLAASMEIGLGRYQDLRVLRNQIEHRLAAPASEGKRKSSSRYYETFITADLSSNVYKLGRIAKAAVWYFSAALSVEERHRMRRAQRAGHVVLHGASTSVARR